MLVGTGNVQGKNERDQQNTAARAKQKLDWIKDLRARRKNLTREKKRSAGGYKERDIRDKELGTTKLGSQLQRNRTRFDIREREENSVARAKSEQSVSVKREREGKLDWWGQRKRKDLIFKLP